MNIKRYISLIILTNLLICNIHSAIADDHVSALVKKDHQKLSRGQCTADREWIEVTGLNSVKAENRINHWIRRKLTVGKKLKQADCSAAEGLGFQIYNNKAELTGQSRELMGVQVHIAFRSGGYPSVFRECATFLKDSGNTIDLNEYFRKDKLEELRENVCQSEKDSPSPLCDNTNDRDAHSPFMFCVGNEGINAYMPGWHTEEVGYTIPAANISKYFNFSPKMSRLFTY
ncbi:MAG: hypothetical protein WCD70_13735 [Alphaproteobacteria bacterium]